MAGSISSPLLLPPYMSLFPLHCLPSSFIEKYDMISEQIMKDGVSTQATKL